jgi:hypothetical protein
MSKSEKSFGMSAREYFEIPEPRRLSRNRCPEKAAADRLRHKYGLSVEDFLRLWKAADMGRCEICSVNLHSRFVPGSEKVSGSRRCNVDHCHETGHVRGLLCNRCNVVLGRMEDSTDLLRSAAAFLERKPTGFKKGMTKADEMEARRASAPFGLTKSYQIRKVDPEPARQRAMRREERAAYGRGEFKYLNAALR